MLRSLILLIYCLGSTAASVSGDIVDNCNYTTWPPQTRCGDTCIPYDTRCICGGETLDTFSGPNHCCVDDSPGQCNNTSYGWGNCPQGRVLSKTQTCNNQCFNDYKATEKIGPFSKFRCGNTSCVPAWKMCRGYSMCEDRSDIRACDETLTCAAWRGRGDATERIFTGKSQMKAVLSNNHFYCNYGESRNDGQYNTITREDETDLDISKQKVKIDFSSVLTPCKYYGKEGFLCGDLCVPNDDWCRDDRSASCDVTGGQFTTNNRALCSNSTVWINQTCDRFYEDGDLASLGRRCSGEVQQCIFPWYLSVNSVYEVNEQLNI